MAHTYDLSMKTRDALLSDRNDVVKAWLTRRLETTNERESTQAYYFEKVKNDNDDVLKFIECDGEISMPELEAITELLVRDDRADEIRKGGETLAKLTIKGVNS